MPETRLSGLDALCLAAESARAPLHTAALLLLDAPAGSPGAATDALMVAIRNSVDRRPRLRSVLADASLGFALPRFLDEHGPDLEHHLTRVRVPSPGGPRELGAIVDDIIGHPLPRGCPLWEMHLIEGLASGALALVIKLHCVPVDGTAAWHLGHDLARGSRANTEAHSPDARLRRAATATHPLFAPARLARASAALIGAAIRDWTSERPGRSPRPTPPSGSRLNAATSGGRQSAHATLSVAALEDIAKAFSVTLEDVVLATIAGALRIELAAATETPTRPLVAVVFKERSGSADREPGMPEGRTQLQRLPIHIGLAAARLRMIRRDQEQGPELLPVAWHRALSEWADANAPIVFSMMARVAREFDLTGELARVANLIVTFANDAPTQSKDDPLRVEHLYPLGPTPEGINLHVAAQRIGAAVDLGIVAAGDTLPDPWRFASGLGDALHELGDAALALKD